MSLHDLHAIAELRRREHGLFENIPPANPQKKILIYAMDPWQIGVVESFLHLALLRRGHRPITYYFDGLLPITAWENHHVSPPSLEKLVSRFQFIHACFGIEALGIRQCLDAAVVRRHAEEIVECTPTAQWPDLIHRGIEIGRITRRDLIQYTMGCFEPVGDEALADFRRHLVHAVMSVDLAHSLLARERPDRVVLVNGKSVMYSYLFEVARQLGVPVTTWEEGMYFDASVVFAHDAKAIDFPVEDTVWQACRAQPVDPADLEAVDAYFRRWRAQSATSHRYYDREVTDPGQIRRELRLPESGRLASLFTNIIWDTNALEKDAAFDGMMDWVFKSIDLTARMDNTTLIVRAHPGEVKCRFATRTPVRGLIERRYDGIPSHVRIVDGRSELSSYEIARMSDVCAVYTSTLGVELTLLGLSPLVCGTPTYRGRGFTHDVTSREQYARLLSGAERPATPDVELLKRFMHLVIFRLVKRPEFFVGSHGTPQVPRVAIETFKGFPDSMPVFASIVDAVITGGSFIVPCATARSDRPLRGDDPAATKRTRWRTKEYDVTLHPA